MFRYLIDRQTELRLLEDQHTPELFALTDQSRAHLRRWLPWVDSVTSPEDTRQFIKSALEQFARNCGFHAGIWYEHKLVGVVGYHRIDWANRKTSIGYWLAASYEGRGLVTKACRALIEYAFCNLKLNRIEIRCATENEKSRAIPKRLDFTQEGVIRQAEWLYDHFVDHVVYGLLASAWKS
jgi:ribosomal-protein-serine acetyltransferase